MPTKRSRRSSSSSVAVVVGAGVGQEAVFQGDDEDDGEFQPLAACRVISVTAPVSSSQRSIAEARVISARKSWIEAPGM